MLKCRGEDYPDSFLVAFSGMFCGSARPNDSPAFALLYTEKLQKTSMVEAVFTCRVFLHPANLVLI